MMQKGLGKTSATWFEHSRMQTNRHSLAEQRRYLSTTSTIMNFAPIVGARDAICRKKSSNQVNDFIETKPYRKITYCTKLLQWLCPSMSHLTAWKRWRTEWIQIATSHWIKLSRTTLQRIKFSVLRDLFRAESQLLVELFRVGIFPIYSDDAKKCKLPFHQISSTTWRFKATLGIWGWPKQRHLKWKENATKEHTKR